MKHRPSWLLFLKRLRRSQRGVWARIQPHLLRELAHAVGTILAGCTRMRVVQPEVLRWAMAPGRGVLFVSWHGFTLVPLSFFRGRHVHAMISASRAGDLQASIFRRFGWEVVRGSSGKSGARAVRAAARVIRSGGKIGLTPDGPTGPRLVIQPGAAAIQRLARCPVVPVGIAHQSKRELKTWDRYQIPLPGSIAVLYFAEPIQPDELRGLAVEQARQVIQRRLDAATAEAERIARSG